MGYGGFGKRFCTRFPSSLNHNNCKFMGWTSHELLRRKRKASLYHSIGHRRIARRSSRKMGNWNMNHMARKIRHRVRASAALSNIKQTACPFPHHSTPLISTL
jgi:hypothetical protein